MEDSNFNWLALVGLGALICGLVCLIVALVQ